jgi:predicted ATP-binding protein involved in virulence
MSRAMVANRFLVPEKLLKVETLRAGDVYLGSDHTTLFVSAWVENQDLDWKIDAFTKADREFSEVHQTLALDEFSGRTIKQSLSDSSISLPLAVYYSLGRGPLREENSSKEEDDRMSRVWAYDGALSGAGVSSITRFIDWFKRLEDYENERRLEDASFRDGLLQAVRSAVEELLPGFHSLRIRRQPMRMVILKGHVELEVNQLSDGERYLLTLGADITRRLALSSSSAREDAHLRSAVILLDEIETHLHPSWQRRVIPALTRAFPNCQFIIATHSPQVLSNVKPESIYVLTQQDGELSAVHPEASFGRDSNRILEDLMGVDERPSEIKEKLNRYFHLIDQGKTEEAQVVRGELEASIGSSDPEFTRADVLLHTRELLSR